MQGLGLLLYFIHLVISMAFHILCFRWITEYILYADYSKDYYCYSMDMHVSRKYSQIFHLFFYHIMYSFFEEGKWSFV